MTEIERIGTDVTLDLVRRVDLSVNPGHALAHDQKGRVIQLYGACDAVGFTFMAFRA